MLVVDWNIIPECTVVEFKNKEVVLKSLFNARLEFIIEPVYEKLAKSLYTNGI